MAEEKPFAESQLAIHKFCEISENVRSRSSSSSILDVAEQWRNLQASLITVHDSLASRVRDFDSVERESGVKIDVRQKFVDLREKLKEKTHRLAQQDELVGEKMIEETCDKKNVIELCNKLYDELKSKEKRINEECARLECEEKLISDVRQSLELEEVEFKERCEALKSKEKRINKECARLECKEKLINDARQELGLKEVEIKENCEALKSKEKWINEERARLECKEKLINDARQELELKEVEIKVKCEALESKEKDINESWKAFEARKKDMDRRCAKFGVKQKDLKLRGEQLD